MVRHKSFITSYTLIPVLYPVDIIMFVTPSSLRITHAAGSSNGAISGDEYDADDDDDADEDGLCPTRMTSSYSSSAFFCVNGMSGGEAGLK